VIKSVLFSESSPNLGGQELQLLQQMQALNERGITTRLLCRSDAKIAAEAMRLGLAATAVPFRNSMHFPSIWRVRECLIRLRPDALICHSGHDANVCALAARLVRNRPVILRSRTYQPGVPDSFAYNHLADLTMVPSAALRGQILANRRIHPGRIHVVYPGIAFEAIETAATMPLPPELASWLASHPGPLLVHVAMLRGEKGHLFMLEVMDCLRTRFPRIRCVMAGEGGMRSNIEARIRELDLTEHVYLAGMLNKVAPLVRRADALVLPSAMEPLGMAQIEALALEVPVVANRVDGIPETIEDGVTGWLVQAGDIAAWQNALIEVLDNPQHARNRAHAGRLAVMERFAVDKNTDQILALIARAQNVSEEHEKTKRAL
jgi:glycosyltransferase involved in cell wall biosynthesis